MIFLLTEWREIMYYKAVKDGIVVDVLNNLQCVKYNEKARMILRCKINEEPEGIIQRNGEKIYQIEDWPSLPGEYETVSLVEFDDSELYDGLLAALNESQLIEEPEEEEIIEDNQDIDLIKEGKVLAMSNTCEKSIIEGFDIKLSDGESHHFSLEVTDQIMISVLAQKALAGETNLPWHADGEPCQFYSIEDILAINSAMEKLVTYHQTYFNSLKMYILAIDEIKLINSVTYGCEIPVGYQSDVYKALLNETN